MRSHPARLLRIAPIIALLAGCVAGPQGPMAYQAGPIFERRIISAVNFDFDSYRIRRESFALLDNAAIALNDPQLGGL